MMFFNYHDELRRVSWSSCLLSLSLDKLPYDYLKKKKTEHIRAIIQQLPIDVSVILRLT